MDILYLHPAKQEADARYDQFASCPPYPFIPVGVVGLVNLLRGEGWQVQGLNLPLELILKPGFSLRQWLQDRSPAKLVMIDLHWYEHSFGAMDVAQTVKEGWPQTQIVVGGLTASNFGEEILRNHPAVDYLIRGDAETPLRLLARHCCGDPNQPLYPNQDKKRSLVGHDSGVTRRLSRQSRDLRDSASRSDFSLTEIPNLLHRRHPGQAGKALQNPRSYFANGQELDALDFVSLDWLEHAANYAALQYYGQGKIDLHTPKFKGHWLTVGRGCVFDCAYCGGGKKSHNELAGRNGYVMRSPEKVVEDIARLQTLGCQQVALSLDIATFGPQWWRPFFALLRDRAIKIGLYNEFFQLPPNEFIDEMGQTVDLQHTEVAISPLSGDETVRRKNGKFYPNDRFLQMLTTLKQYEVPIFVYFSLNLPGESFATFKKTLELADQVGKNYPHHLLRMLNPCHTLDPLSPMSRQPEAYGMTVHYKTFQDYYSYCKGTAWQPRTVTRGEHRGFEMKGRPAQVVEQMAQIWDLFAQAQKFRCFPVPRGW